jgi:hypothetical protein
MRSGVRTLTWVVAAGLLTALGGCGSDSNNTVPTPPPGGQGGRGGSGSGKGGSPGTGGDGSGVSTGGSSGVGTGGSTPGAGGSGEGDAAGGGAGGTPLGGDGPVVETPSSEPPPGGWMGYPGVRDLTQVDPTGGCGKPATDVTPGTWKFFDIANIPTPAGQRDNPGDGTRRYFVRLPPGYMPDKKYKVLIAASSCTGGSQALRAQPDVPMVTDAAGGAILISPVVEPGVWDPDECYDDKDPNSIEHPFLERFLAQVGEKYCYDKNRVFVQGHSSGGWYSNMVGWTHTTGLIRGMSSNGGGLPDITNQRPILNGKPMAGLWIHPTQDDEQPMAAKRAVSQALVVNKCEGAGTNPANETVWQTAPGAAWAMAGAVGCKKYNCPAAFPVIFCQPPGGHGEVSWQTDAAWAMFSALP